MILRPVLSPAWACSAALQEKIGFRHIGDYGGGWKDWRSDLYNCLNFRDMPYIRR